MTLSKDTHCSYCGTLFATDVYPKTCVQCHNITYRNPIPIVVTLLPVVKSVLGSYPERGVLIQQRNIEPQKGQWALPSGYVDFGETWQEAAAREVMEEMGIETKPNLYDLWTTRNSATHNLLIFARYSSFVKCEKEIFIPNVEVLAIDSIFEPRELAFPSHTEEAHRYIDYLK